MGGEVILWKSACPSLADMLGALYGTFQLLIEVHCMHAGGSTGGRSASRWRAARSWRPTTGCMCCPATAAPAASPTQPTGSTRSSCWLNAKLRAAWVTWSLTTAASCPNEIYQDKMQDIDCRCNETAQEGRVRFAAGYHCDLTSGEAALITPEMNMVSDIRRFSVPGGRLRRQAIFSITYW